MSVQKRTSKESVVIVISKRGGFASSSNSSEEVIEEPKQLAAVAVEMPARRTWNLSSGKGQRGDSHKMPNMMRVQCIRFRNATFVGEEGFFYSIGIRTVFI